MLRFSFFASLIAVGIMAVAADDRVVFGLKGDVASVTLENSDADGVMWTLTVDFDEQGLIVAVDGEEPQIERDGKGRIIKLITSGEDEEGEAVEVATTVSYNQDGRVATTTTGDEETWVYTYEYDPATGFASSRVYSCQGDSEKFSYTYSPERDSFGNWTSRIESADGAEEDIIQRMSVTLRQGL